MLHAASYTQVWIAEGGELEGHLGGPFAKPRVGEYIVLFLLLLLIVGVVVAAAVVVVVVLALWLLLLLLLISTWHQLISANDGIVRSQ